MERGFESWFRDQKVNWQPPNPNLTSDPFGLRQQGTIPSNTAPPIRQEPCGWFYGLPRYRQVASPDVARGPNGGEKKFLVFDQSGDQTTLIYSSGIGVPPIRYQFPSSNNPEPQSGSHLVRFNELIKENGDDLSEMREDTEELNALLYSDDENEYSENEETSTGHSPSSMTGFIEQKGQNGNEKEEAVASSGGFTRKREREDGGSIVNSLEDTASSGKSGVNCSGNDGKFDSSNKRLKKEKMKETINLLQNLIPGDKNGMNAIMVIDEAIHYLRSLKVKAKALGLDSL